MPHRYQVDPQRAIEALRGLVEEFEKLDGTKYVSYWWAVTASLGSEGWKKALEVLREADQLAEFEQTHQDEGGEG